MRVRVVNLKMAAMNKFIRTKLENKVSDINAPMDLENDLNPMFKKMNDYFKEVLIDMYSITGEELTYCKNKFNQNKIYMYINMCNFYEKSGNINKRYEFMSANLPFINDM